MKLASEEWPEGWEHEIGQVKAAFGLLECDRCAVALVNWFDQHKISCRILRLRTRYPDESFIVSDRVERLGYLDAITGNGTHYGVEALGLVFDNLPGLGLSRSEWLADFHCPSEAFILEEFATIIELNWRGLNS